MNQNNERKKSILHIGDAGELLGQYKRLKYGIDSAAR
jgi:hypothetical protein